MERIKGIFAASVVFLFLNGCSLAQDQTHNSELADTAELERSESEQVVVRVFWRDFPGKANERPRNQEYRFPKDTSFNQALTIITSTALATRKLNSRNEIDWDRVRLGSTQLQKSYDDVVMKIADELEKRAGNITLLERQRREFNRLASRLVDRDSMASYYLGMNYPLATQDDKSLTLDEGAYILVLPYETDETKRQDFEVHESLADKKYDWYLTESGHLAKTREGTKVVVECFDIVPGGEQFPFELNAAACGLSTEGQHYVFFDGLSDEQDKSLTSLNEKVLMLLAHGRFFH